ATPGPGSNSWARVRTRLANNKTYTIAASGGDFTTMQAAIDYTKNNLDLNGYTLSLLYAAGSFTDSFSVKGTWVGQKDHTSVVIGGQGSGVTTLTASGDCITVQFGRVTLSGIRLGSTGGNLISVDFQGFINYTDIDFGGSGSGFVQLKIDYNGQ